MQGVKIQRLKKTSARVANIPTKLNKSGGESLIDHSHHNRSKNLDQSVERMKVANPMLRTGEKKHAALSKCH